MRSAPWTSGRAGPQPDALPSASRSRPRSWPSRSDERGPDAGRLQPRPPGPRHRYRDVHGRRGAGQRGRRARRADPDRPRGGWWLRARRADRARRGTDHRGPRPGTRPVPRGGLVGGPGAADPAAVPVGRHVPQPLDVRGHEPRGHRAAGPRAAAGRRTGRILGPGFARRHSSRARTGRRGRPSTWR